MTHFGCHGNVWLLHLGNEFGEPVIQERQIRIADNPLSSFNPISVYIV